LFEDNLPKLIFKVQDSKFWQC